MQELRGLETPLGLLLLGLAAGLVGEWLASRLIVLLASPRWQGREVLRRALRGVFLTWFVLAGLYAALLTLEPPQRTFDLATRALTVLFVLSLTLTLARLSGGLVALYTRREGAALPATSIIVNLSRLLVLIVGGLILLRTLSLDITPLLTTLGVGALAVALALQDTLSNLFAGLQLIAARQLRPGDHVRLDSGDEGAIADIGWRNTILQQLGGSVVIVPNAKLAQAIVINNDLPDRSYGFSVEVAVDYASDLAHVEAVTLAVAREVMQQVPGAVPDDEPSVRFGGLGEYSIAMSVNMRAATIVDQYLLRHEFIKRLLPRYNAEGIVIPVATQTPIELRNDAEQEKNSPER